MVRPPYVEPFSSPLPSPHRKKIIAEGRERRMQGGSSENLGLGKRVPSFYTSPSLVNLSGLGVADQPLLTSNSGGSMQRFRNDSGSDLADGGGITMDSGSEDGKREPSSPMSTHSAPGPNGGEEQYTKTTSMAAFYYRKNRSSDQLNKSNDSLPADFRSKYE